MWDWPAAWPARPGSSSHCRIGHAASQGLNMQTLAAMQQQWLAAMPERRSLAQSICPQGLPGGKSSYRHYATEQFICGTAVVHNCEGVMALRSQPTAAACSLVRLSSTHGKPDSGLTLGIMYPFLNHIGAVQRESVNRDNSEHHPSRSRWI